MTAIKRSRLVWIGCFLFLSLPSVLIIIYWAVVYFRPPGYHMALGPQVLIPPPNQLVWSVTTGRSASEWRVAFEGMALVVLVSTGLGGVVGFICRGRIRREIIASAVVTTVLFFCIEVATGRLSFSWSLAENISNNIEPGIAFAFLSLLPSIMMSVAVGQWGRH